MQPKENVSGRITMIDMEELKRVKPKRRQQVVKRVLKQVAEEVTNSRPQSSIELADMEADS